MGGLSHEYVRRADGVWREDQQGRAVQDLLPVQQTRWQVECHQHQIGGRANVSQQFQNGTFVPSLDNLFANALKDALALQAEPTQRAECRHGACPAWILDDRRD